MGSSLGGEASPWLRRRPVGSSRNEREILNMLVFFGDGKGSSRLGSGEVRFLDEPEMNRSTRHRPPKTAQE